MILSAAQAAAEAPMKKAYPPEKCEKISAIIDFVLDRTVQHWEKLSKRPQNEKAASELGWNMELVANYTGVIKRFVKKTNSPISPCGGIHAIFQLCNRNLKQWRHGEN